MSWTGSPFAKECVVKHLKGQVRRAARFRVEGQGPVVLKGSRGRGC